MVYIPISDQKLTKSSFALNQTRQDFIDLSNYVSQFSDDYLAHLSDGIKIIIDDLKKVSNKELSEKVSNLDDKFQFSLQIFSCIDFECEGAFSLNIVLLSLENVMSRYLFDFYKDLWTSTNGSIRLKLHFVKI